MTAPASYKAVIFDMDGTILDTVDDLTAAINYAMAKCGHRHDYVKEDGYRFFGSGVHTAIQRALAKEKGADNAELLRIGIEANKPFPGIDEDEVQRIMAVYMPYYKAHNADLTRPFPGIVDLLRKLRGAGIRTAVVSNKPDNSVVQLAEDYFDGEFDLAIGERPDIARKPAPDMNFLILEKLGIDVKDAVYIGDTEIDLATAKNTGMDCIMVDWGFRREDELKALGADVIVSSAAAILAIVTGSEK